MTLWQNTLAIWKTSCVQSIDFVVLIIFIPFKPNSGKMLHFMKKVIPPNFQFLNCHQTFPIEEGINFLTQIDIARLRYLSSFWKV